MADIQVANTDADLSGNTVVTEENAYTITGLHTFSRSTNAPFACISGAAVVAYLDSDKLDGQEGTYYLAAANATGTLAVNRGGTGAATFTDGGVLLGSGTSAISHCRAGRWRDSHWRWVRRSYDVGCGSLRGNYDSRHDCDRGVERDSSNSRLWRHWRDISDGWGCFARQWDWGRDRHVCAERQRDDCG